MPRYFIEWTKKSGKVVFLRAEDVELQKFLTAKWMRAMKEHYPTRRLRLMEAREVRP